MQHQATPALVPNATSAQTRDILGAMRGIAETEGAATDADRSALANAAKYIFAYADDMCSYVLGLMLTIATLARW